MKIINKIYRIVNSAIFSFKYLKNPLVIFEIPLKKEVQIELKNGEKINIKSRLFPHHIELFQMGWKYNNKILTNKFQIITNDENLEEIVIILAENLKKMYAVTDLNNKTILDIGGYNGETALFFIFEEKAKEVFIYEPVNKNFEMIKKNLKINNINEKIFIFNKGVSNKDGSEKIFSNTAPGIGSFGTYGNNFIVEIPVESWNTILERHRKDNIYLAKVDCEGGEKYLVDTNKELIKTIPNWVIEIHSKEFKKELDMLFYSLGYKKKTIVNYSENVGVYNYFK